MQPRDRACGTRGNGVVDERDAVELTDALHAVRHTGEGVRDLNARRVSDQPVGRGKGRHIVFHIVRTGDADLGGVQDLLRLAVMCAVNDAVSAVDAVFHRADAAEIAHVPRRLSRETRGMGILRVEHQAAVRPLAAINTAFGRHIVLEVRMDIQMVR